MRARGFRGSWHLAVSTLALVTGFSAAEGQTVPPGNWDPPAIDVNPNQDDFVTGKRSVQELIDDGRRLFRTPFNLRDGVGRPAATGDSKPTIRIKRDIPLFQRVAGPDASSCTGCHNRPLAGGAGDFATNVFVGAHFTDPPTQSIAAEVTNERTTRSIFGAGAVEMVAREMTMDLHDQRDWAKLQARATGADCRVKLESKGVRFGYLVVRPDGSYATDELQGVDNDLVVKPFGVKGVAVSLRELPTSRSTSIMASNRRSASAGRAPAYATSTKTALKTNSRSAR